MAWTVTEATDRYQKSCSAAQGWAASQIAGTTKVSNRLPLLIRTGFMSPSACNIPEQLKVSPMATKFHELIRRYSTVTETTAGSLVKGVTNM